MKLRPGRRLVLSAILVALLCSAIALANSIVGTLSALVGVSERGLRNAFNAVRGMSPKRFAIHDRLNEVRRALSDPRTTNATVTHIATEHGFFELGRFAGRYKAVFGETPSETLRSHSSAQ